MKLLRKQEVAKALGVSAWYLDNMIECGEMPNGQPLMSGGRTRFWPDTVVQGLLEDFSARFAAGDTTSDRAA